MQEIVSPLNDAYFQVTVQHQPDLGSVGLGVEPNKNPPEVHHFMDTLYADHQETIGESLLAKIAEAGLSYQIDFRTKDAESAFFDAMGRAALDAVIGSAPVDGLWTWLDRSGINRLIRLLRKARDSSFGRDE